MPYERVTFTSLILQLAGNEVPSEEIRRFTCCDEFPSFTLKTRASFPSLIMPELSMPGVTCVRFLRALGMNVFSTKSKFSVLYMVFCSVKFVDPGMIILSFLVIIPIWAIGKVLLK
ncbi:hypothetical protein SDC9_212204 [bioreactor metagenome]|uniref:Uncharacterized protein n=1 Tax=bioreactor metagenome TaxID=1076179 RepID=A0A645JMB1_9ZZZZ